ncbi:MAG: hypothetical protein F9K22_14535 [Bacteroidetes bacterium]|nr:MAG: hypothetical protein F9K22_14535 [Bacteroidota bacterium]
MRSLFLIALIVVPALAQRLPLPERTDTLPGAAELFLRIRDLTRTEREAELFRQVMAGNVPRFLRTLAPVTVQETVNGTLYTLRYYVTPDYLSLGSDSDHMLMPMTPLLAQRIADRTGSLLPTPRMSDQIYAAAPLPGQNRPFVESNRLLVFAVDVIIIEPAVGQVVVAPTLREENGLRVLAANTGITVSWPEAPTTAEVTRIEFYLTPTTGAPTVIGTDSTSSDGASVTYTFAAGTGGYLTARAYLTDGRTSETATSVQILVE